MEIATILSGAGVVVAVTVTSVGVISIRESLRRIARGKEDGHV